VALDDRTLTVTDASILNTASSISLGSAASGFPFSSGAGSLGVDVTGSVTGLAEITVAAGATGQLNLAPAGGYLTGHDYPLGDPSTPSYTPGFSSLTLGDGATLGVGSTFAPYVAEFDSLQLNGNVTVAKNGDIYLGPGSHSEFGQISDISSAGTSTLTINGGPSQTHWVH
jgi:hypothetical protein